MNRQAEVSRGTCADSELRARLGPLAVAAEPAEIGLASAVLSIHLLGVTNPVEYTCLTAKGDHS